MPLPIQGRHTTVVLSIDPTQGQSAALAALGELTPITGPQQWTVQNFQVNPRQDVITSRYLGTNEADEDMQPDGFEGSFTLAHKTNTLLQAFNMYQAAKEVGVPIAFLITQTISYRDPGQSSLVINYLRVELNISESYDVGRHGTLEVSWRSPKRTMATV